MVGNEACEACDSEDPSYERGYRVRWAQGVLDP